MQSALVHPELFPDVYLLPFARSCLGAVLTSSDHVLSAFAVF